MAKENSGAALSLVVWGVPAVLAVGYGVWCVIDGWYRPGYEHADFSRFAAPVAFLAAIWCAWRGIKEYKAVKAGPQGQGSDAPADTETSPQDGQDDSQGTDGTGDRS